jgi:predicted small lipoprotein YifL
MRKAFIALATLSMLVLLIAGCKAPSQAPEADKTAGEQSTAESTTGQAADTTITGGLSEVDSLNNELNDPELEKTDEYLDEVTW